MTRALIRVLDPTAEVGGEIAGTGGAAVFPGTPPTGWCTGSSCGPSTSASDMAPRSRKPRSHGFARAAPVTGFHLACPWGGGPTIARDAATGHALLRESARLQPSPPPRALGVPETNGAACKYLKRCGLAPASHVTRMTLGPPVAWRPEMVFGVFNYAVA